MKIKYSKKRFTFNLLMGGIFTVAGFLQLLNDPKNPFIFYLQLALGLFMIGTYFYEKRFPYLEIEDGLLTKNNFRRKEILLDEIIQIKSLPGKIRLYTAEEKLNINTALTDEAGKNELLRVLGSLELERNPFTSHASKAS